MKLGYFAKSNANLDEFDRSKMDKDIFRHAFQNLSLFEPLEHHSFAEEDTIIYGVFLLHPDCELVMESWLEYLMGFSVRLKTKTGEGFVMMPNPLKETLTGTITTNCVICEKYILHNGATFYISLWDEEEFVFCGKDCLEQAIVD